MRQSEKYSGETGKIWLMGAWVWAKVVWNQVRAGRYPHIDHLSAHDLERIKKAAGAV